MSGSDQTLMKHGHRIDECRIHFLHTGLVLTSPGNLTYPIPWSIFISQGCSSDISSMVKEAQKQVIQIVHQAIKYAGQLAALSGDQLRSLESSDCGAAGLQVTRQRSWWKPSSQGTVEASDSGVTKQDKCLFFEAAHTLLV